MKKIYQSARKSLRFRRPEIKEIRKINDAKDGSCTGRPMRANRVARLIFDFFAVWKSKLDVTGCRTTHGALANASSGRPV